MADPPVNRVFALSGGTYWSNSTLDVLNATSDRLLLEVPLGTFPDVLNLDLALGLVVVGNKGADSLTIVNASTDRVTATISIGCPPIQMALDPGTGVEYVLCQLGNGNGVVAAVKVAGGAVLARIPTAWGSTDLAFDPANGEVYVANGWSNNVTVISAANNTVVDTVRIPNGPVTLAVDAANDRIYVLSSQYTVNLTVLSGANNSVAATIPIRGGWNSTGFVAVDSATSQVYAGADSGSTVTVLSAPNDTVLATLAVGPCPASIGFDPAAGAAFVVNGCSYNLSFISTNPLRVTGSLFTGANPYGIAIDSLVQRVYLVDDHTDSVEVVNATSGTFAANVSVGVRPSGVLFDPFNGDVYVSQPDAGEVAVLNGSTYGLIRIILAGIGASHLTLCPSMDRIYVASIDAQTVTAINATSNAVVATHAFDSPAASIACDSADGDVFVGSGFYGEIFVLNGSSAALVTTVRVPQSYGVHGFAVDSASGEVYGDSGSATASFFAINSSTFRVNTNLSLGGVGGFALDPVYDAKTDTVWLVAGIHLSLIELSAANGSVLRVTQLGSYVSPDGLAVDPSSGDVVLLSDGFASGTAEFFNGTSGRPVGSVGVGHGPDSAALDVAHDLLLIANHDSDNISVIELATHQLIASAPTGAGPDDLGIDGFSGAILATSPDQGTVTVLGPSGPYPVRFREQGLPTGATWSAALGGIVQISRSSAVVFGAGNGTYQYALPAVGGFVVTPRAGAVTVSGAGANIPIQFSPLYSITIEQVGLPTGTRWGVTLNGTTVSTNGSALAFSEPNGSYTFQVQNVPGWWPNIVGGTVQINGSGERIVIEWTAPVYLVNVTESGLPTGTGWEVKIGSTTGIGYGTSILFWLADGNYTYSVVWVNDSNFAASESSQWRPTGQFQVLGGDVTIGPILYVPTLPTRFPIDFGESGLAANTSWSIQLAGQVWSSSFPHFSAVEPNGTYRYTILPVPGYNSTPESGWANVSGGVTSIYVAFTEIAPLRVTSRIAVPSRLILGNETALVVTVQGGVPPYSYDYPVLPEGCRSANVSTLLCVPNSTGNFSVTVRVTDTLGSNATASLWLTVQAPASPVGTARASGWPEPATWVASALVAAGILAGAVAAWRSRTRRLPPRT